MTSLSANSGFPYQPARSLHGPSVMQALESRLITYLTRKCLLGYAGITGDFQPPLPVARWVD